MTVASLSVTVIVAAIAAGGAWLAQRAAAKASIINTTTATRMDAEKEAYERARQFDTDTIRRQNDRIAQLEMENSSLRARLTDYEQRLQRLESTSLMKLIQAADDKETGDTPDASDQKQ